MITHKSSQLMMEGRVRAALQLLSRETRSGPLSLDRVVSDGSYRTVRDILEDKHPNSEPAHVDAILNEDLNTLTSILSCLTVSQPKSFKTLPFILQALLEWMHLAGRVFALHSVRNLMIYVQLCQLSLK